MGSDLIETASGAIRGTHGRGVWGFKGVPYGADTAGEGRFRPARPPKSWLGVRECVDYGPSSPQIASEQMRGIPIPERESMLGLLAYERVTGEDCLRLNIWSPSLDDSAKLPVLVWLHGGGWGFGSASSPLYDFSNLSRHRRVVTVGVNHRLGARSGQPVREASNAKSNNSLLVVWGSSRIGVCPTPGSNSTRAPGTTL